MMLKQLSSILLIAVLCSLLSACLFGEKGYIHDREQDYLFSKSDPNLKIPAGMSPAKMNSKMPIPAGRDFSRPRKPNLAPPSSNNVRLLQQNQAAMNRAKNPISAELGQGASGFPVLRLRSGYKVSWYKVKAVLTKLNYQLMGSDQRTGVLEIMSANNSAEVYQIKISAGSTGTIVAVLDQTGSDVDAKTASKILSKIKQQLSH